MGSIEYLAKCLGLKKEQVQAAKDHEMDYRLIQIPKKDGSFRSIHSPHKALKYFQRKLLQEYLYGRTLAGQDEVIHGFKPHRSCVSNASYHANRSADFVLKLDLKDAFPSVTVKHLRDLFGKIFAEHFTNKAETLKEFIDFLLPLVTFNGVLPQGAPTSPHLLNLVLCNSGLVSKVRGFLKERGIVALSIYADDFAVSSVNPIPNEVKDELIELIERESDFRINRKKVFYFKRENIAPIVTGLRLVRTTNPDGTKMTSVRLPKQTVRKIRGLIHRMAHEDSEEVRNSLAKVVRGYLAHAHSVYGKRLPRQIAIPLKLVRELQRG